MLQFGDEYFNDCSHLFLHLLYSLLILLALLLLGLARTLRTYLVSQLLALCLAQRFVSVQLGLQLIDLLL